MFRDPALLPDPFPPSLRPIIWAKPLGPLVLIRFPRGADPALAGTEFVLQRPYHVMYRLAGEIAAREITVPRGFVTDLASVPRLLRPFVGRVGRHLEAAVVHDYLYVQRWRAGGDKVERRGFSDRMMLAMMRHAQFRLRWPVYLALRALGGIVMGQQPEGSLLGAFPALREG